MPPFSHIEHRLPPGLLRELATSGDLRRFAAGEKLFLEGEASDSLYILVKGELKVFSSNSSGREVVFNILEPGEMIGEMLLDGGPRSASVKAAVDSQCVVVAGDTLRQLLRTHPDFAEWVLITLISRLRYATRKIRGLALDGVYERVAALLEETATEDDGARRVPSSLTQVEIAKRVGASREMVNHVLRDLVRGGFVQKDARHRMTVVKKLPKHW